MAAHWLPPVLALEVLITWWVAEGTARGSPADPRDEPHQSAVGAPRVHGGLLQLGFGGAQSTVAKCLVRRRGGPSQTWKTFLRNHVADSRPRIRSS
jgi:hypothetical protein